MKNCIFNVLKIKLFDFFNEQFYNLKCLKSVWDTY